MQNSALAQTIEHGYYYSNRQTDTLLGVKKITQTNKKIADYQKIRLITAWLKAALIRRKLSHKNGNKIRQKKTRSPILLSMDFD